MVALRVLKMVEMMVEKLDSLWVDLKVVKKVD